VLANFGTTDVQLPAPAHAEVELASWRGAAVDGATLTLPAACTVWLLARRPTPTAPVVR
jgi:hypothetical protein